MGDLTKESILKSNNQQWSSSAKIEAEGLEWLYNDPTAQQTNESKLESYLLGESIPGARGELQKTSELEDSKLGSLLKDETSNRVYEQTLNKFREDPLFIIKKLEMQQKQVLDKYSAIASNFDKKRKELSRRSDKKHTETHRSSRDKPHERRHRSSREPRSDRRSRRSEERHRDSHRRDHRDGDRDRHKHSRSSDHKHRKDDKHRHRRRDRTPSPDDRRSRKLRSPSPEPEPKRKKGPEVPRKYDPLKYAFGVNDDICPPDEILETAKRREREARAREIDRLESSTVHRDEASLLEEMRQEGSSHIREKIENIAKLDLIESVIEKAESPAKRDYISTVKRQAFDSADMAGIIRRKASKQQDPFNENI
ncbi:hypothetical protein MACK_000976 [Theileria orientalis]|uniref:Pre-mRNA splicing factor n=1 Tax=Theileria orientalis TaxID=68886 RepID=A0A976QUT3_THEOR|nr:hypothetical protein MACK_000976 [Theileria orientalis]